MNGWQVTATTIHCDAVDDDVTIMVYKDWSTSCTGYKKYGPNMSEETLRALRKRGKKLGINLGCEGPQDFRVTSYQNKIAHEEKSSHLKGST